MRSALNTFALGGIHPPESKLTKNISIEVFPLPKQVIVPVNQNLGAPANPCVGKGDLVRTGQLIAKGEAFISSNIHSPVSGKVLKVDDAIDHTGFRRKASSQTRDTAQIKLRDNPGVLNPANQKTQSIASGINCSAHYLSPTTALARL